ncbi:hypothetical protein H4R99_008476 [Coemansia sp. RSA 1722]|nr:hypothetical protein IWW45_007844 [Coemansia sp. RSA 485]KAJ2586366.1 hypothetical protein H4R99_008476 [Coemansia sp. RSA 1722]KAJ2639223.1 hypothetical protein GGF40_000992 [Coemansia sp. RSA 1286]
MMYLPITPLVANADDSAADSLPGKASASGPTAVEMPPADGDDFVITDSDFTDESDNDAEDFWLDAHAADSAVKSLSGEADASGLAAVETPQADDSDSDTENILFDGRAANAAAESLPGEAGDLSLVAVETPPADGNEFIDTGAGDFFRTPCSNLVDSESDFTDDSDSDAEDFWNVIRAANAAADSLPGEGDDLSLVAVETPQVDGADNEEVNDSDDESESVPEDHPLVASTADNESVSLPVEADGLGLDAVEAPLTTVKGALHCSAGKDCYHRPKRNGSIPSYSMPTFASAQWHRKKFAAY